MIHNIYYKDELEKQMPKVRKAIATRNLKDKTGYYIKVPGAIGNLRTFKTKDNE